MKNNKIISLVLCFVFILTSVLSFSPVSTAYASTIELFEEDYSNALEVLKTIAPTFPLSDSETTTRAEFVAAVTMILGKTETTGVETGYLDVAADHKYSGNIKYAKDTGLISNVDLFTPDASLTYAQAIKILMCATGHGKKAEYLGGYPAGYFKVAAETNVGLSTVSSDNVVLTNAEAIELIFEAACTDILDVTSYGDKFGYAEYAGKNILSVAHKIYMAQGVVEANKSTGLYTLSTSISRDGFSIAGKTYVGEGYNDFLGKRVRVFFKEGSKREIVCAYPVDNTMYSFTHDDDISLSGGVITVTKDDDFKEYKYTLGEGYSVIYNGKYYAAAENTYNTCLNPESGIVELIDNTGDGKYDVIIIKSYEYGVIDNVNVVGEKIYDKNKINGMIDLSGDIEYHISTSDGVVLSLEDLKAKDVVGYAYSKDGKSLEIVKFEGKLGGTFKELSDGVLNLGKDKNVELSRYFTENVKTLSDIKLGTQIVAYLGLGNQVVYIEEYTAGINYGLFIDYGDKGTGLDSSPCVKLYTTDGETLELSLPEKVIYNGRRISLSEAKTNLGVLKAKDVKLRVIKYSTNANGELTKIYETVLNDKGPSVMLSNNNAESCPVLYYDKTSVNGDNSTLPQYGGGMLYPFFVISPSASVLRVPERNEDRHDMDYYASVSVSSLDESVKAFGYDVTRTGASFILWPTTDGNASNPTETTSSGVVESITNGVDDDGLPVKIISMYLGGTWRKVKSPSEYKLGQEYLKSEVEALQPGDVVRASVDSSNTLTGLRIDFSYKNGKKFYGTRTGYENENRKPVKANYNGGYIGYAIGYVYNLVDNKAIVVMDSSNDNSIEKFKTKAESESIELKDIYPVNLSSGTVIFVELKYDRNDPTKIISADVYKEANASSVESYFTAGLDADFVVSRSRFHSINTTVIYVNGK